MALYGMAFHSGASARHLDIPTPRHPETSGCGDLPRSKAAISACRVRFAAWPQPAAQQYRLDVADVAAPADPGRGSERRFERARFYKQ
jgi:hypothetical protein